MAGNNFDKYQRQALAMIKAQQDAYLEAVRAWHDASLPGGASKPWPEPAPLPLPADTLPTPTEVAEAQAEFAARMLEEQSRFMRRLSDILAAAGKNR
jgi:hypothetical protein